MKLPQNYSLRFVLIVPFVLQIVGFVGLTGYLAWRNGQRAVDNLADRLMTTVTEHITDHLNHYLNVPIQIVAANQQAMIQGRLSPAALDRIRPYFWQQINGLPKLEATFFANDQGINLGYIRVTSTEMAYQLQELTGEVLPVGTLIWVSNARVDGLIKRQYYRVDQQGDPTRLLGQLDIDLRQLNAYQTAKRQEKVHWSPLRVFRSSGMLGVIAIAPVRNDQNQYQGMFSSQVSLPNLSYFLRQVNLSTGSQIFIMDRDGVLVATSNIDPLVMRQGKVNPNQPWAGLIPRPVFNSTNPTTREIAQQLRDHFGGLTQIQGSHTLQLTIQGDSQFVQVHPYQDQHDLDWLVVVGIPKSEFSAEITANTHNTWRLTGLAFAVALTTGLIATRWIVKPIQRLSRASQTLAEGHWQQSLRDNSPITELSVLTQSFNRTATQLQQAFDRIQAALDKSEEKFTTVFRTSPDPIAIARLPDGYILEANNSQLEFFGYQREELIGHTAAELNLWADPSQELQFYEHFQTAGMVRNLEMDLRTKSGQIKTGLVSAELCNLDGQEYVIVVTRDISDRKQLERALKTSADQYRLLFESNPNPMWVFDLETLAFLAVNPAAIAHYGYSETEFLAMTVPDIRPPTEHASRENIIASLTSGTYRGERQHRKRNGELIDVEITSNEIIWEGRAARLVLINDITERKQSQTELQQAKEAAELANQAKSTFLANMSHELRTPLNVMLGFAQLMNWDPTISEENQDYLQLIQSNGEHLLRLINEVLDLSKIEAGQLSLEEQEFDLLGLLHGLHHTFSLRAKEKGLQLALEVLPGVPQYVRADEAKLNQVLINLVNNAIKFTRHGSVRLVVAPLPQSSSPQSSSPQSSSLQSFTAQSSTVQSLTVQSLTEAAAIASPNHSPNHSPHPSPNHRGRSDRERVKFQVIDTGVGMTPEEQAIIFNAFAQASAGQQSKEGTGLGLAITQRLVELMGGHITVDSIPHQGSTFQFTIQLQLADSTLIKPGQPKQPILGLAANQPNYRILVVDDQAENRLLLLKWLTKVGFAVREAGNGLECLQQWQDWQPDLILMDIRMPGMDGYETTEKIRALEQAMVATTAPPACDLPDQSSREPDAATASPHRTVIIALTAQAFVEYRAQAIAAGCDTYIVKPFRAQLLFEKIAQYLGVKYRYAMQPDIQPQVLTNDPADQALSTADLSVMSPEWLADLNLAARCCDEQAVTELITKIPSSHSDLAIALNQLNHNFAFERIINLTEPLIGR